MMEKVISDLEMHMVVILFQKTESVRKRSMYGIMYEFHNL